VHFAVLTGARVPDATSGGGALTAHTVLTYLLRAGHRVTAIALHDPNYGDSEAATAARVAALRELGAAVVPIVSRAGPAVDDAPRDVRARARRLVAPSLADLYPQAADAPAVRRAVAASGCDAAFVYHWEALVASRGVTVPRVAGVGDPSHLPRVYRWRREFPSRRSARDALHLQAAVRRQPAVMASLLEECAAYGAFAAHHAAWLRAHGARRCRYLHTPVPDAAGPDAAAARSDRPRDEPARFLLLGHLRGVATLDGLEVFGRMLGPLDARLGRGGYVVDVVGGAEPPPELRAVLSHPAVRRHGHTDDPGPWLRAADALLVPTSIPLGIRVRIITGFSYATPVVSHVANANGIPELADGRNALLARTPQGLADAAARVARDGELRRTLARGGRTTYERCFSPPAAGGAILRMLEGALGG
jgi:glycosyltransferase involved in cell wall biosynthesis